MGIIYQKVVENVTYDIKIYNLNEHVNNIFNKIMISLKI